MMELASTQVAAKSHALDAARKDFLPKLLNSFSYFHFDSDLGTVLTTPGIFNPAVTRAVPVINQDAAIYTAAAIQPITPLWKVHAAVEIGEADVGSAQAQRQLARRELTKGVEQLYFGLLAAQKIKGWARTGRCRREADGRFHECTGGQNIRRRSSARPNHGEWPGCDSAGAT